MVHDSDVICGSYILSVRFLFKLEFVSDRSRHWLEMRLKWKSATVAIFEQWSDQSLAWNGERWRSRKSRISRRLRDYRQLRERPCGWCRTWCVCRMWHAVSATAGYHMPDCLSERVPGWPTYRHLWQARVEFVHSDIPRHVGATLDFPQSARSQPDASAPPVAPQQQLPGYQRRSR